MELRKLKQLRVSAVGMGTYKTFDVTSASDIVIRHQIIDTCIEHQVTFIDSSPMYGHSEEMVGITTVGKAANFQLATKVWCQGRERGAHQIAQSFARFQTDYIDVYQIHNLVDWQTHLETLEQLKAEGKIGLIGITHYAPSAYTAMMQIMRSGRIDTVQIPYNVVERQCEERILPLAAEHGIGVIVMEPLEKGRFVTRLRIPPDLTPLTACGIRTWAQALLAWVLADPRVSVVIPATSRPERIEENAVAGSVGHLPPELRDYIRKETERCIA